MSEPPVRIPEDGTVVVLRPAGGVPATLRAELDGLRQENARLREQLVAERAVAGERAARIEDLEQTLHLLPARWAGTPERPSGRAGDPPIAARPRGARPADEPPRIRLAQDLPPVLLEVEALRQRLERSRLEVERRVLEREHRRLLTALGRPET